MDLDPEVAYVLGLLHDIGRCRTARGVPDVRHVLNGYAQLTELGYEDAAVGTTCYAGPYGATRRRALSQSPRSGMSAKGGTLPGPVG